jgi:hypothetical protein
MAINFPDSPSDGDEATLEGKVYTYSASKNAWTPASSAGGWRWRWRHNNRKGDSHGYCIRRIE